jgi:hypothetical protein
VVSPFLDETSATRDPTPKQALTETAPGEGAGMAGAGAEPTSAVPKPVKKKKDKTFVGELPLPPTRTHIAFHIFHKKKNTHTFYLPPSDFLLF